MSKPSKKMLPGNVRDAALSILIDVDKNQAYSNLLLHHTIETYALHDKDRGLLTALTYGTLQYQMTLDFYLEPFVRGKLDPWVRQLLRMSVYQLQYLDKIPPHAVVHEAVEIAKKRGHKRIAPTVNGILRSILRVGVPSLDTIQNSVDRIAIETSHPKWLIERWVAQFGEEQAKSIATNNNQPANLSFRVNTVATSVEEVKTALLAEGIETRRGELIEECLISENGNPANTSVYKKGLITIQDESSMLPIQALQLQPGMSVLDMCAAPGGKTTHIAEKMQDQGTVYAHDLHQHKVKLIDKNAERLKLTSIKTSTGDSRHLVDRYGEAKFDRILLDAPCSGFGVIRRKPEIKYTKTLQDIEKLTTIQFELLNTAVTLLKDEGILVYSTCTIESMENVEMVKRILNAHPTLEQLSLDTLSPFQYLPLASKAVQVFPQHLNSDGFFVAAFKKKAI